MPIVTSMKLRDSTIAATLRSLERAESWLEKRRRRRALGAAGLTQVGPEEDEQSDSGDDIQEDVDHQDDVLDNVSDISDLSEQPEEREYFDDVRFDNYEFVMPSARSSPTRDSSGYSYYTAAETFPDQFTDDWVNPFILVFNSNCPVDITFVSSMLEQLGVPSNERKNQLKCETFRTYNTKYPSVLSVQFRVSIGVSKILKGIMRKDQASPFILLPPTCERSVATLMMNLKRIVDVLFDNILIKENELYMTLNGNAKCYDLMALIEHFPQQTIKAFKMLNKNTKKDVKSYAHRLGCPLDFWKDKSNTL